MKPKHYAATILVTLFLYMSGCAYDGPMLGLNVGFMGASVGVTLGAPKAPILPPLSGFSK